MRRDIMSKNDLVKKGKKTVAMMSVAMMLAAGRMVAFHAGE